MVLLHGGSPRGAERIAACWADNRKVPQVAFKPDWTRDRKAAPFKRNDRLLEALPVGILAFPGSGISANLADKARQRGIPVWQITADSANLGAASLLSRCSRRRRAAGLPFRGRGAAILLRSSLLLFSWFVASERRRRRYPLDAC
jgi:hypothetical protein